MTADQRVKYEDEEIKRLKKPPGKKWIIIESIMIYNMWLYNDIYCTLFYTINQY